MLCSTGKRALAACSPAPPAHLLVARPPACPPMSRVTSCWPALHQPANFPGRLLACEFHLWMTKCECPCRLSQDRARLGLSPATVTLVSKGHILAALGPYACKAFVPLLEVSVERATPSAVCH